MSNSTALRIPYGTKDILPGDARLKRELEDRVAGNFLSWGYDEAITPTFEYADTFALSGAGISDESMRFMDRNNRTVMLRSEMTTPGPDGGHPAEERQGCETAVLHCQCVPP